MNGQIFGMQGYECAVGEYVELQQGNMLTRDSPCSSFSLIITSVPGMLKEVVLCMLRFCNTLLYTETDL